MNSRLMSIIRKEFIQIFRDVRTLIMILIIPIMQLFLLGYSATNDVRNVPLAVLDQSRSPESRTLLDAYRAADYFRIAYDVQSEAEIETLIAGGDARAAVIIPPDYAQRLSDGNAQVAFILDGSDPTSASTALSAAQLISQSHSTENSHRTLCQHRNEHARSATCRSPHQGLVQPRPGQRLLYDPRRDRHDFVCHRRHPHRHLSGAGT